MINLGFGSYRIKNYGDHTLFIRWGSLPTWTPDGNPQHCYPLEVGEWIDIDLTSPGSHKSDMYLYVICQPDPEPEGPFVKVEDPPGRDPEYCTTCFIAIIQIDQGC